MLQELTEEVKERMKLSYAVQSRTEEVEGGGQRHGRVDGRS